MPDFIKRWFYLLDNNRGETGPKKDDDDDDDLIDVGDDDEDVDDAGLEIDLDDSDDDDDDDDDDEDKGKRNKKFAQMRVENKRLAEENERLKRQQTPAPVPTQPAAAPQSTAANPDDPRNWTDKQWDDYAKEDWKGAIDLRAQINAENLINQQAKASKDNEILEKSKSTVQSKHPELNDDNSEKTKVYLKILEENPRYLTDPKGPIHAMRDMEERMRELGYPEEEIVAAENRGAKRELERQSRVAITSHKGRTQTGGDRKVQLTKDEVEFCKFNGIDTKEYAKNKLRMSKSKGELQV